MLRLTRRPGRRMCPMGANDKDVMEDSMKQAEPVRRPSRGRNAARAVPMVLALVTSSLLFAACGRSVASPTCTLKELVTAAGKGYLKLPPTHDNDAGRGRIPDTSPDADLDANQRAALCNVYKSEKHLPG
jgi:hypothetical protein